MLKCPQVFLCHPLKLIRRSFARSILMIDQYIKELMLRFTEAFDLSLGQVTAIGGWWHDDSAELNDTDIDAYISPLIQA